MFLTSLLAALTLSLFSSLPLCGSPQAEGMNDETSFRAIPKGKMFNVDDEPLPMDTSVIHTDDSFDVYLPYGTYYYGFTNTYNITSTVNYISSGVVNIVRNGSAYRSVSASIFLRDDYFFFNTTYSDTELDTLDGATYVYEITFNAGSNGSQGGYHSFVVSVTFDYLKGVQENSVLTLENPSQAGGYSNRVTYANPLTPTDVVNEIVNILVSGLVDFGTGLGTGISTFVTALALNAAGDGLSVYFTLIIVFAAVALSIGLTRLLYNTLTSLGN